MSAAKIRNMLSSLQFKSKKTEWVLHYDICWSMFIDICLYNLMVLLNEVVYNCEEKYIFTFE